jgi:hypothetical protein
MTVTVGVSQVEALTYVVLSEAKKHVPYEESVGTTECVTLYPRCRTNRGCYNVVQLYCVRRNISLVRGL